MPNPRVILHVDMDAFFASVEQRDHPELREKPVLVGYDGPRGVVAAASYEARVFGCHSAQPMSIAKRRCPQAIIVGHGGKAYHEASKQVFAILRDFTPLVEPLSIDEAFLDVTGSLRLLGDGPAIARAIKQRIVDEVRLTASIGVAPNKFLAKLASDMDKPDGLTIITRDDVHARIATLSIGRMWGIGPAAEAKLAAIGVRTFADLAALPELVARSRLGKWGPYAQKLARGEDDRPVVTTGERKSVSHEQTFGEDISSPEEVRAILVQQADSVARTLRAKKLCGRTVTVKTRYGDFETITRSHTFREATDRTDEIAEAAAELFDIWAARSFRPVRLIGVGVSHLEEAASRQPLLFEDVEEQRAHRIDAATDTIRKAFGEGAIRRAGSIKAERDVEAP